MRHPYALARWSALCRFLDDGRIELDNNTGRTRHPSDRARPQEPSVRRLRWRRGRWAIVASLLATAKLNDVEPFAYLKDVLERLSNGHPMSRLDDLLPWNRASTSCRSTHVSGMHAYASMVVPSS